MQLSEQDVVSCAQEGQFSVAPTQVAQQVVRKAGTWAAVDGCQGGSGVGVWLQMFTDGRVTRSSSLYDGKYSAAGSSKVPCRDSDKAGHPAYYANNSSLFRLLSKNVAAIQAEIFANGPVSAALSVYDDFMSYSSGVYTKTSSNLVGAHAVVLIGWGTDGGKDYWLFANSWVFAPISPPARRRGSARLGSARLGSARPRPRPRPRLGSASAHTRVAIDPRSACLTCAGFKLGRGWVWPNSTWNERERHRGRADLRPAGHESAAVQRLRNVPEWWRIQR